MDRQEFLADEFWSMAIASASTTPSTDILTSKPSTQDTETICQNGALMGESAVPGAYSSACMLLSERVVPLPRYQERMSASAAKRTGTQIGTNEDNQNNLKQSDPIVVQQKAGGSGSTGMTVWNSGLLLTRLLDAMVDELQRQQSQDGGNGNVFWENQDVIELGCGTGLCSIAAHRLGAKSVLATDGNPRVLQLADANIRQNCYGSNTDGNSATTTTDPTSKLAGSDGRLSTIRAENLQWGFMDAMDYSEAASFIIGADLTYNPASWDSLAETIATVLKTENNNVNSIDGAASRSNRCYALYLSVGHDGFNVNAEMDGFLSVAKEKGLVTFSDGVEGIDLSALLLRTLSDQEKKILAQSGGFRVSVLGRKQFKRR